MKWRIPLFKRWAHEDDVAAVAAVLRRGTYWADGPEIRDFEAAMAAYVGTEYALAFNSGTSALHTLLLLHDVRGREVIVPSFTFVATASAVVLAGGTPIFADTEPATFGLCAEDVRRRITSRTRAITTLHYGGTPACGSEALRQIADEHELVFIEDAAQSLSAAIGSKRVGTFGHSAMFSLCQDKVLAAGEGGVLVTDSRDMYERGKLIRSHGRLDDEEDYFYSIGQGDYVQIGYNFRMPTMIAALALSRLTHLDEEIVARRAIAQRYDERFSQVPGVTVLAELDDHFLVRQKYAILLQGPEIRDGLQQHLAEKGVMSRVYFRPIHTMALFRDLGGVCPEGLPGAEALSGRVLNLPIYRGMTDVEVDLVATIIEAYMRRIADIGSSCA